MEKEIITRFLDGRATPAEREQVYKWLKKGGSTKQLDELFLNEWNRKNLPNANEERKNRLLNRINNTINQNRATSNKKDSFINALLLKSAASWFILLGVLFLALSVIRDNHTLDEKETSSIFLIERTVLPGQKLVLQLPDKSKVWVNANSKVSFPNEFGSESREVYLEGEAFFEVSKDPSRPFNVFSGGLTTEVLGTKFNVKTNGKKTDVALVEGKVRVKFSEENGEQLILSPGQVFVHHSENPDNYQLSQFDRATSFLWKDGIIRFDNESFINIIDSLEDWYGVSIRIQGALDPKRTVSGTFANDNLENMLIGLGFTLDFTFVFDNNSVIINPLKPMKK